MTNQTLWKLEPHTLGKHLVLRRYLNAWIPILARHNERILFIDGFAGPGQYIDGEDGSPVISLKSLIEHPVKNKIQEMGFLFIEEDKDRVNHLDSLVSQMTNQLPNRSWASCVHGLFDEKLSQVLNELEQQRKQLAPAFVMIDPFGVSGTPMHVIERILKNPRSEIYASFMYESINRFKETPEFEFHLDRLFGSPDWKLGLNMPDSDQRKQFFFNLYENALRNSGAKYVLHFELYSGNRLIYAIFFATRHLLGCDRMKQAIWKIAPWGDFAFRPVKAPQLTLGLENENFELFQSQLVEEFTGKDWVSIEEIEVFAQSDKTPFHTGQLKRKALVPLEVAGRIEVDESSRKRKFTYPTGTRIKIT